MTRQQNALGLGLRDIYLIYLYKSQLTDHLPARMSIWPPRSTGGETIRTIYQHLPELTPYMVRRKHSLRVALHLRDYLPAPVYTWPPDQAEARLLVRNSG